MRSGRDEADGGCDRRWSKQRGVTDTDGQRKVSCRGSRWILISLWARQAPSHMGPAALRANGRGAKFKMLCAERSRERLQGGAGRQKQEELQPFMQLAGRGAPPLTSEVLGPRRCA